MSRPKADHQDCILGPAKSLLNTIGCSHVSVSSTINWGWQEWKLQLQVGKGMHREALAHREFLVTVNFSCYRLFSPPTTLRVKEESRSPSCQR